MGNYRYNSYKLIILIFVILFVLLNFISLSKITFAAGCVDTSIIFLRGSGQNPANDYLDEPLNAKDFGVKEPQSYKFFSEVNKRLTGTKEFISLHDISGKYNNYGYEAVSAELVLYKPHHRTDVINRYYESVADGKEELVGFLKQKFSDCPYQKIILGGYSQGAHVVGEALWDLNPTERGRITFAALFGDPKYNGRQPGLSISQGPWARGNANRLSAGALGFRNNYLPADVLSKGSWCDKSDPICTARNIYGSGVFVFAKEYLDHTHSNAYQAKDGWIEQSANEIAVRVTNDTNRINQTLGANWIKEGTTKQLDIALVIDSSGTMNYEVERLKQSARYFIEKLYGQSWDTKVAVVSYSDNDYQKDVWRSYWLANVNQDFTKDQNKVYNAIHAVLPYGMANNNSAMYSGMMKAMNELSWRNGAQKKIITITNNAARESDPGGYKAEDVIRKALELDPVAISSVDTPYNGSRPATASLQNLSTKTNGTVITGSFGDTTTISNEINVINLAPVAIVDGSVVDGIANGNTSSGLELSAAYSYDPDSYITGYKWDCNDDGTWDYTDVQPGVLCQYYSPYSGLVVLEVTSADGQSAKAIQNVNITNNTNSPSVIPNTPVATINVRTATSATIKITNTYKDDSFISISDANGNIYDYFNPNSDYILTNITSSELDIYLRAENDAGFSESLKLTVPAYIPETKVEEPAIKESPKSLPVSESNPEWLLEAQKAFYEQLANTQATTTATSSFTPASSAQQNGTFYLPVESGIANNQDAVTPASPNTQVAGVSSAVKQKYNYSQNATTNRLKPSQIILYIGVGLLVIGIFALFTKLTVYKPKQ